MLALLFNLKIDMEIRQTASDRPRGIRWTLFSTLEDLDFVDDLALVSHTQKHARENHPHSMFPQQAGMKISQKKTEVMMLNIPNPSPVKVNGGDLPTTENVTYLGSIGMHDGGAGSDIRNCLNKFRDGLRMLNNVR